MRLALILDRLGPAWLLEVWRKLLACVLWLVLARRSWLLSGSQALHICFLLTILRLALNLGSSFWLSDFVSSWSALRCEDLDVALSASRLAIGRFPFCQGVDGAAARASKSGMCLADRCRRALELDAASRFMVTRQLMDDRRSRLNGDQEWQWTHSDMHSL